jgi:hypothetical protein
MYTQYGSYGFRLMFLPSTLSIFFNNSGDFADLISNIDSGERLNIYNPFGGKTLFTERNGALMDFSGLILLLGSLFALCFGYEALHHKKYLEFLSGFPGYREVFFSIIASRIVLCFLVLLLSAVCSRGLLKFNGFELSGSEYRHLSAYFAMLFLVLLFFFSMGTVVSHLKSRSLGIITMIGLFFIFIIIIPCTVGKIISEKAGGMTDSYYLELEKLKVIMEFEKRAYEKIGIFRSGKKAPPSVTRLVESYWQKDFKKIQRLEKKLEREMGENIKNYQGLAMFFPVSFYLSVGNEISSRGYDNFMAFYRRTRKLKEQFLRFYFNKKFYTDHSNEDIESFVKGEENLFYAHSRLPGTFPMGMVLTFAYTILLFIVSWLLLVKQMKPPPGTGFPSFELEKGKSYFILCDTPQYRDNLFRFYRFKEDIIAIDRVKPGEIDTGMDVRAMIKYFSRIRGVDEKKVWGNLSVLGIQEPDIDKIKKRAIPPELLKKVYAAVSLAGEGRIVVVKDFVKDENRKFEEQFRRLLYILQKRGKIILYLGVEMFETRLKTLYQQAEANNAIVIDLMSVSLR